MSQMKLLGFSAWQLWINCAAITTDCGCRNKADFELPNTKTEYVALFVTFFQISQQPRRFRKNKTHQKILIVKGHPCQTFYLSRAVFLKWDWLDFCFNLKIAQIFYIWRGFW